MKSLLVSALTLSASFSAFAVDYSTASIISCTNKVGEESSENDISVTVNKTQPALGDAFDLAIAAVKTEIKLRDSLYEKVSNGGVLTPEEQEQLDNTPAFNKMSNLAYVEIFHIESYTGYMNDQTSSALTNGLGENCKFDKSKPNRLVYTAKNLGETPNVLEAGEGIFGFSNTTSVLSINTKTNTAFLCQKGSYKDQEGNEHQYGTEKAISLKCTLTP